MKPYVLCHMLCSVDGRILGSRWRPKGNVVAGLFERLHDRLGGGSWLCGRVTAQEFAKGTQIVIISHAKRTMSMVDVLYGVTMQEPGVSTRISVRFEEAAQMAEDRDETYATADA